MKTPRNAKPVVEYAIRYGHNRGLRPEFPRLAVGMMKELPGWPVRNADGGADIAYYETVDAAQTAVSAAYRAFRKEFAQ